MGVSVCQERCVCLCGEEVGSVCSRGLAGVCPSPMCLGTGEGLYSLSFDKKETRKNAILVEAVTEEVVVVEVELVLGVVLIAAVCLPMQMWNVCFPQCSAVTERRVGPEWAGVQL